MEEIEEKQEQEKSRDAPITAGIVCKLQSFTSEKRELLQLSEEKTKTGVSFSFPNDVWQSGTLACCGFSCESSLSSSVRRVSLPVLEIGGQEEERES